MTIGHDVRSGEVHRRRAGHDAARHFDWHSWSSAIGEPELVGRTKLGHRMLNIFRGPATPTERYPRQDELDSGALYLVWDAIRAEAGFLVPVVLGGDLADRLEVPPAWRVPECFESRLAAVLAAAHAAVRSAPPGTGPIAFRVAITDNTSAAPENLDLSMAYDGFAMIVKFR